MSLATMTGATTAPTQLIQAKKGTYAYRRFGHGAARPLLFLQHFVGTLDNWDPAVTDPLATGREVVLFDNAGVGRSTGSVPSTVSEMSSHALDFLDAFGMDRCARRFFRASHLRSLWGLSMRLWIGSFATAIGVITSPGLSNTVECWKSSGWPWL